ncbi:MaoC-like dehydratase [Nocardia nova SH22a]|uniref:MaoC-like dehydratase n=1 Tax=Nocardia nova SH22a TaxID=1415166 RepID=W5TJQ1_9NOCA|nr:MaoC family dehydratase N-terminal domain-containing protein [Nocardia nova]AHH19585.1 MaoC-like dehydratase [Nocardia nova SH22a]
MRSTTVDRIDGARSLAGSCYRTPDRYSVTAQRIRAYAAAVHNRHPAHFDRDAAADLGFEGLVAPPTFATLPWLRAAREVLGALYGPRPPRILHAEQLIRIGRPLVAGDVVTTDIHIDSVEHFPDYCALVVTTVLRDLGGTAVQTGTATLLTDSPAARTPRPAVEYLRCHRRPAAVVRTGATDPIAPARVPGPATTPLTAGTELPRRTVSVHRGELLRYAALTGASGRARQRPAACLGMAPGMLRLALTAGVVTSWLGDPARVRVLRAEFSHHCADPAATTEIVEFRGRVRDTGPEHRTLTVDLDARCRGRRLFAHAAAAIEPDDRVPPPT